MRALLVAACLLTAAPALATTDGTDDTDATYLDASTASELAGDDGGLTCSSLGTGAVVTIPLVLLLAGLFARRR